MQVRNENSYGINSPNFKSKKWITRNDSGLKQIKGKVSFGQEPPAEEQEEKKKNGLTFKRLTNVLGVAAWIGVVGYSIVNLKLLKPQSMERILASAKKNQKIIKVVKEKIENTDPNAIKNEFEGKSLKKVRNYVYNMGENLQNIKTKLGDELFNNGLYAIGTLIIMPLVVLFSPFGKKNSSKEDKTFAVLRQPLSVAATFGMQLTFDKLIDKYVPEVMKQNKLEDKSILNENGEIKLKDEHGKFSFENFEKIKYNTDSAKDGFKELFKVKIEEGGLKGILDESEIEKIFKDKSFEKDAASTRQGKLKEILNKKYEGLKLKSLDDLHGESESVKKFKAENPQIAENLEKLLTRFKKLTTTLDNNTMAIQKSKTMVNVIAASIIGCTFLNVIYGKSMKAYKSHKNEKQNQPNNQNDAKEVK